MSNKIIIEGNGYTPLKDFESWRLAALLPSHTNAVDSVKVFGRHNTTDEVFTLLCGTAYMVTAGKSDDPINLNIVKLEQGTLFVVDAGEWHAAILEQDAQILITENRDTSDSNTEEIKPEQLVFIQTTVKDL